MTLIDSVVDQTRDVASSIALANPTAPVPTCPGWTLQDLVEHIGATQRWVTRLVVDRVVDPMAAFQIPWESIPADPTAWSGWLEDGAAAVVTAFGDAPEDAAVFDPSGGGDGLGFWSTRLFGEVTVHRIDAALTLDRPYMIAPALAAAAIDDWLSNMSSAGWASNVPGFADAMRGSGQTIRWSATDVAEQWTVRRTDAPLELTRTTGSDVDDQDDATVEIAGDALDLLFVVSRRRPLSEANCSVTGERSELEHLIDHMVWIGAS